MLRLALTCALAVATASAVRGETLTPGSYEVVVQLDLPFVETTNTRKTERICLASETALAVLSDNNPLGKCPSSNMARQGSDLTFDIKCEGTNAAQGHARYTLTAETFDGLIEMKMGGKNMTMSETQHGHRVGECAPRS